MSEEPKGQIAKAEPKGQPTDNLIKLGNGQMVEPDKLAKMYEDTQAEITKLQMAAKEVQGQPSQEQIDQEAQLQALAQLLVPELRKHGFADASEVSALKGNAALDKLIANSPALESKRDMIADLAKANPEMAYADVVEKYNLGNKADPKAPSGDVIGDINRPAAAGSADKLKIENVNTPEDLEKFEKEQNIGKTNKRLEIQQGIKG